MGYQGTGAKADSASHGHWSGRPSHHLPTPSRRHDDVLPRHYDRASNHQNSELLLGGMVLLLAVCGWAIAGEEGARWAVTGSTQSPDNHPSPISPETMARQFGARPMHPHDWPALFAVLSQLCRRAGLPRMPDLYLLPEPHAMNAYALGVPRHAAVTLTEGLLRGMTLAEITGILAHEIGHIRNNDGWAMNLAAALQRATALLSLIGRGQGASRSLGLLLDSAPFIGRMLQMGLSRVREFDADAVALELVDDPHALVAALHKLERHHTGRQLERPPASASDLLRYLRSHPETWERVSTLWCLAS